jgi:hypothetical protein
VELHVDLKEMIGQAYYRPVTATGEQKNVKQMSVHLIY